MPLACLPYFNLFKHVFKSLGPWHLGCGICSLATVGAGTWHHDLSPEDLADLKGSVKQELHDVQEVRVDLHSLQCVSRSRRSSCSCFFLCGGVFSVFSDFLLENPDPNVSAMFVSCSNVGLQVLNSELKDLTSHFKGELQQLSDKLQALAPWPKV